MLGGGGIGNYIELSYRSLRFWAIAYMALPLFLFLLLWLRPLWGIPLGLLFLVGTALAVYSGSARLPVKCRGLCIKQRDENVSSDALFPRPSIFSQGQKQYDEHDASAVRVPRQTLIALVLVAVIWCVLSGQGGFWAQSSDWEIRNAIFRDLVTHSWPVYYNDGMAAMSYYIAYWLPAAAIAKIPFALGLSIEAIWPFANVVLLLWTVIGVLLIELLVLVTLRASSGRAVAFCVSLLVLFSTPDILGLPITGQFNNALQDLHLEWWASGVVGVAQYSSITTCLFWVFNQAIVPWICTLCFLNERCFSRYLLIWACCFACGPFPSVGLAVLMLAQGVGVLICRERLVSLRRQLASICSIPNFAGVIAAVVMGLFFIANTATTNTGVAASVDNLLVYPLWLPANRRMIVTALVFVVIEGLLLPLLLMRQNWRKPLFWAIVLTLVACPFIRVGQAADFCMRASVPAILCLYVLCAQRLMEWWRDGRPRQIAVWALIACLVLGAVTPAVEFYRGFYQVKSRGIENVHPDVGTLEGWDFSVLNFGTDNPDGSFFFRELAGRP